ncbi:glycerophosphodiester phosphodiesterase [Leadbettera azotonutricia]|uniref:Glycerophosphodiester phosphodiesterase n=1 Tax=Leadbettera azotonutricia (strain ATCC BAA-888 / DSM 13862 / ZAS-9) TaxID=545695 RepID=F5YEK5_LEAAZ|nr:glycerophosphodiester phosphodiesterase family protein [Leadbettera azotonutricia]AEF82088.1 glycerophosphodiester phosphodiesterase [Leadbettera azotonutricia ZAS-9]
MVQLLPERQRPLLFAHRGCSSLAPENTMASFLKAQEIGAPGIELDIHVTRDGKLAVAHDDNFKRTAGDSRAIEDLSYDEVKAIDTGSHFSAAFKGEYPPLMENVLEAFCPAMYIDIELKTRKTKDDPLPGLLAELLKRFDPRVSASIAVSSFNPFAVRAFKKICPNIPTAVIYCTDKDVPFILRRGFGRIISGCDYLKPMHKLATPFTRFRFTVLEKKPMVPWTIDDTGIAEKMLAAGCTGIISNRPQDMLELVRKYG